MHQCALQPTDSHSYLLYSSSHPSHVKNSIPYSQFLRLRRLCSDDSDFSLKSEEVCDFFDKRGYPAHSNSFCVSNGLLTARQQREFQVSFGRATTKLATPAG